MAEKETKNVEQASDSLEKEPSKKKKTKEDKVAKEKETKKAKKAKKPSKIVTMFKNLKSEFKKITWASPKSTFKNFGIVIAGLVSAAVVIGLIDIGLQSFFNFLAGLVG